ncbi:Ribonuclease T [Hydrogenovibrio crunogenus]|uniref:Ribonuclease T n=1 Tax=Hydrogenovibrio crunogenus TaxID=39765 RepID=A0A4P7P045_9GAMM|nr:ribonuclease T [Hydrogenovibrio crunogenus]QBZ82602.1 Ribonuclease T [Hydrogenovibrio crunogenus]RUM90436.1 MAG: ribonuclease T [Thiomicrospira sp.]
MNTITHIKERFRGFLPVVVDVETAGFDPQTNALIEIAIVTLKMNSDGTIERDQTVQANVLPFKGSQLDKSALKFIGVEDPTHPFRMAVSEKEALEKCFTPIRQLLKETDCSRAILVGHNAFFDLSFVKAAADRCKIKSPFHEFSTFDTVSLAGLAYGQTVLAKAVQLAEIEWDNSKAHSAEYDTIKTADLFCKIVNQWPIEKTRTLL